MSSILRAYASDFSFCGRYFSPSSIKQPLQKEILFRHWWEESRLSGDGQRRGSSSASLLLSPLLILSHLGLRPHNPICIGSNDMTGWTKTIIPLCMLSILCPPIWAHFPRICILSSRFGFSGCSYSLKPPHSNWAGAFWQSLVDHTLLVCEDKKMRS